jgi:hypothetical protein
VADRLFDTRDRRVAGADFSSFAELPAQPFHRRALAAHAQEGAIFVGALFQHFATGEDPAALLLGRPGQE